ncbi:ATP-binding protein [Streptomyces antimycoticus]|uniref:ATP-binding protein n=1 Tax=Streptomyces antimycoticus TaxID=68175 RepID=UPI00341CF0E4
MSDVKGARGGTQLSARRTNQPFRRPYTPPAMFWPATSEGVRRARAELARTLAKWGVACLSPDAELVLSELMANALAHGCLPGDHVGASFLRATGGVIVEVHDSSDAAPVLRTASSDEECGRGLAIVEATTVGN